MINRFAIPTLTSLVLVILVACSSAPDDNTAPPLGAVCARSSDCAAGLTCDTSAFPTAGTCSTACAGDTDCRAEFGANSFCIGANRCVLACRSAADCSSDQICNGFGWCTRKSCDTNAECWSYACDVATHTCNSFCVTNADCQIGDVCSTGICYPP